MTVNDRAPEGERTRAAVRERRSMPKTKLVERYRQSWCIHLDRFGNQPWKGAVSAWPR